MSLHDLFPLGQITDLGDLFRQERLIVKGRRVGFQTHDGVEFDTTPADRVPNSTPVVPVTNERINAVRDLRQDKKFLRTESPVDEFGTPSSEPYAGTMVYSTANPELLNLADNGDGSCSVAAVGGGALGPADLTFTATPDSGGAPFVKVDTINVVPGSPEGFATVDGPDEEVTPDPVP